MQEKYHVVWFQRKNAQAYVHLEQNGGRTIWSKKEKGATEFSLSQARNFIFKHSNTLLLGAVEA